MAEAPAGGQQRVRYIVSMWVPEEQLDAWNRWHSEIHIPDVVAQPQIRSARKYRVASDDVPSSWQPQYITIYELDSLAGWEDYRTSPAGVRLRQDYADRYGQSGKIARQVLVEAGRWPPEAE